MFHSQKHIKSPSRNIIGNFIFNIHNLSFLIKPVFALAMKACPYRKDFYLKLGADGVLVKSEMDLWLAALEKLLAILAKFYIDGNHGN